MMGWQRGNATSAATNACSWRVNERRGEGRHIITYTAQEQANREGEAAGVPGVKMRGERWTKEISSRVPICHSVIVSAGN